MYRPPGWDEMVIEVYMHFGGDRKICEDGADAMLILLEPIIRDKAPSSSLVDILYGGKDDQ